MNDKNDVQFLSKNSFLLKTQFNEIAFKATIIKLKKLYIHEFPEKKLLHNPKS